MDNFTLGTIAILVSNTFLSSYPILIKNYILDVDIFTQLLIRCTVYITLAFPFMVLGKETLQAFTSLLNPGYLLISVVNLIHIYTSYRGFELLNPGIALTTFYTYPIIQLFLSNILFQTKIQAGVYLNLLGCFLGFIVLNRDMFEKNKKIMMSGFVFIGIAALTEAMINLFYKNKNLKNPFSSLYTLYAPAFVFLIVFLFFRGNGQIGKIMKIDRGILKKIILFNLLIGGLGYTIRLFGLTKVPMSWFSTLSFTNGISVFLLAWWILGDPIKIHHILGSAILFYNIDKIKKML